MAFARLRVAPPASLDTVMLSICPAPVNCTAAREEVILTLLKIASAATETIAWELRFRLATEVVPLPLGGAILIVVLLLFTVILL
ncbi:hypothetical protein D3C87_1884270 [compost metagenome]